MGHRICNKPGCEKRGYRLNHQGTKAFCPEHRPKSWGKKVIPTVVVELPSEQPVEEPKPFLEIPS